MAAIQAVGIDLGTTYSCISYLNKHGEPITLHNEEGEMSTPSVVLFDGDDIVVGTEALRNAVVQPERVVQHAKRCMGDWQKSWVIDGTTYSPTDISALILRKLLAAAEEQIGPIPHAVITVPAQFSDAQRKATMDAGLQAGLERVDLINEPVAAALCYVLGTEGDWFAELANQQQVMVYDLGGGTFDLSLVNYSKDSVKVVASSGDLNLGGLDWNEQIEKYACDAFSKKFRTDPRLDPESRQTLLQEIEQTKRSLSVRNKASLICQHQGHKEIYSVTRKQFELITKHLLKRTENVTQQLLDDNNLGWARVDAVLVTGGSTRMPMVSTMLERIAGWKTQVTTLSPDQSISHGASYFAGMLLTNRQDAESMLSDKAASRLKKMRQESVSARALGVLVTDLDTGKRVPQYLIPANTPLPVAHRQTFGTVIPNQRRVHVAVIESGTSTVQPHVVIGNCVMDDISHDLPVGSPITVTIRYDEQARIHVSAKDVTGGVKAKTQIVRKEHQIIPEGAEVSTTGSAPSRSQLGDLADDDERKATADSPPRSTGRKSQEASAKQRSLKKKPPRQASQGKQKSSRSRSESPQALPPLSSSQPVPLMDGPLRDGEDAMEVERPRRSLESADRPVPLCNQCGEALDIFGRCKDCDDIDFDIHEALSKAAKGASRKQ